ncbi:hypothetical protein J6590_080375 [Homalodisca vitripennis]|nr:hypothetical protein J6590_080375 [Homalodisca vitripennis]
MAAATRAVTRTRPTSHYLKGGPFRAGKKGQCVKGKFYDAVARHKDESGHESQYGHHCDYGHKDGHDKSESYKHSNKKH